MLHVQIRQPVVLIRRRRGRRGWSAVKHDESAVARLQRTLFERKSLHRPVDDRSTLVAPQLILGCAGGYDVHCTVRPPRVALLHLADARVAQRRVRHLVRILFGEERYQRRVPLVLETGVLHLHHLVVVLVHARKRRSVSIGCVGSCTEYRLVGGLRVVRVLRLAVAVRVCGGGVGVSAGDLIRRWCRWWRW